jgi:CRP-like cAMP-binding protein
MSLGEDDAVMVQDESYRLVCLVLEGDCRVEAAVAAKEGGDGARRTVATIGPGNVFGEMSFLTGAPATASVVADSAAKVCVVTYDKLDQLFELEPVLVLKLYHHLCKFVAFRIENIKAECALFRQALAVKSPRRDAKRKEKRSSKRH